MFCSECGKSIPDGSRFCKNCGAQLPAGEAAPERPGAASPPREGGGGFWTSPGGIALVIVLALVVIAGIAVGIVFLVRGGADGKVDEATFKVWEEYEQLLEDDSDDITRINTDRATLDAAKADLEKSLRKLSDLREDLEKNAGTESRRKGSSTKTTRDVKADELSAALEAYEKYLEKLGALVATLAGANLLDQNTITALNSALAELTELSADVRVATNKFLSDNSAVVTVKIDPDILKLPRAAAIDIQAAVTAAQEAELQRIAAEKAAADAAAAAAEAEAAAAAAEAARYFTCPNCNGRGTVQGQTCGTCGGSGRVTSSRLVAEGWVWNGSIWLPPDYSY